MGFYAEQLARQLELSSETISFRDVLCQLLDAVKPRAGKNAFTLADLRRSKMCPLVVDTLCNLPKLLTGEVHELRLLPDLPGVELTEWDRWAALEYQRLAAEDDDETDLEEDIRSVLGVRAVKESPF